MRREGGTKEINMINIASCYSYRVKHRRDYKGQNL